MSPLVQKLCVVLAECLARDEKAQVFDPALREEANQAIAEVQAFDWTTPRPDDDPT